jgi:hypothetical protein
MQSREVGYRTVISCPNSTTCSLQDTLSMVAALRIWQSLYCDADWQRCERRRCMEAGAPIPTNLLPDGRVLGTGTRGSRRCA